MIRIFPVLVLAAVSSACSSGSVAGDTPEKTFDNLRDVAKRKDWKTAFTAMDPEQREIMISFFFRAVELVAMYDETARRKLEDIRSRHEVVEAKTAAVDMATLRRAAEESLANVKDLAALFADMVGHSDYTEKMNPFARFGEIMPRDLKIEGDRASVGIGGGGDVDEVCFVRRNGLWYLVLKEPT